MADKKYSPYRFRHIDRGPRTEEQQLHDIERQMGGRMTEATLSNEQRQVYNAICYWYEHDTEAHPVLSMGGYAGTGKSTLVSVLAGKYVEERVAFCSYTGKATSVLRSKLTDAGVPTNAVSTVHSLMYHPLPDEMGGIRGWKKREVLNYDLIVVDEASMLDESLYNDLRSYGIPILAVGDHGQLPPVFGNFNLMEKPNLRLEKIHRQAENSPILALSEVVRRVGQIPRFENSMELQLLKKDQLEEVLDSLFSMPEVNHDDIGMLCYTNRTRGELNTMARRARWSREGKYSEKVPTLGDQVICLRNVEATIFNGMRGTLQRCEDTSELHYDATVRFEDDGVEVTGPTCKVQFGLEGTIRGFDDYENLTNYKPFSWDAIGLLFDYGYALTVHKSQGSQFEHAIVMAETPQRMTLDEKRRWLYTAVTRCSKYLVVLS